MVIKKECVFCGEEIEPGTGKMVVDPAGSVLLYCSSKCEKNTNLKRSSRKVKWTADFRKEKAIRVQHLQNKKTNSDTTAKEKSKK